MTQSLLDSVLLATMLFYQLSASKTLFKKWEVFLCQRFDKMQDRVISPTQSDRNVHIVCTWWNQNSIRPFTGTKCRFELGLVHLFSALLRLPRNLNEILPKKEKNGRLRTNWSWHLAHDVINFIYYAARAWRNDGSRGLFIFLLLFLYNPFGRIPTKEVAILV